MILVVVIRVVVVSVWRRVFMVNFWGDCVFKCNVLWFVWVDVVVCKVVL